MSKTSKLNNFSLTKVLRSSTQKLDDDDNSKEKKIEMKENSPEIVSKYFVTETLEPQVKNIPKKRRSIEIKCEETDRKKQKDNEEEKWFPENWKNTLDLIREMRKDGTAPVDEMGCHKCSDTEASPAIFRYQSLVALMLSSQTKDQVTHAAMERLRAYGCTPSNLVATPDDVLAKLIYPVGFYKRKVQYIKKVSDILLKNYNGDIPDTIEGLCALPGVGPKMGHICMQVAWNQVTGIGVDTHVHRICNRLQWVKKQAKTPEDTRKQLETWLPKDLWSEINHLLVGFGQEICLPQNPKCQECLNNKFCPFPKIKKSK